MGDYMDDAWEWFEENCDDIADLTPSQVRDRMAQMFKGKGGRIHELYGNLMGRWADKYYAARATTTDYRLAQAQTRIDKYALQAKRVSSRGLPSRKVLVERASKSRIGQRVGVALRSWRGKLREVYAGKGQRIYTKFRNALGRFVRG